MDNTQLSNSCKTTYYTFRSLVNSLTTQFSQLNSITNTFKTPIKLHLPIVSFGIHSNSVMSNLGL